MCSLACLFTCTCMLHALTSHLFCCFYTHLLLPLVAEAEVTEVVEVINKVALLVHWELSMLVLVIDAKAEGSVVIEVANDSLSELRLIQMLDKDGVTVVEEAISVELLYSVVEDSERPQTLKTGHQGSC
ncbi:hypothetical protein EV361DRAFT_412054 [Lentinula raphanica]|nr:hypothetical protein EV361DRAFT_412054 [Lentinula raphanica]